MTTTFDYATLPTSQRWAWHAEVYAFRRIVLGVSIDEKTSPCDPKGEWFNEDLIRAAAERLQERRHGEFRRRQAALDEEKIRSGRAICNRWAWQNGYADFADAERDGRTHADVIRSMGATELPPVWGFKSPAAALGVTAREWTSEQMAAGRRALGLEQAEAAE